MPRGMIETMSMSTPRRKATAADLRDLHGEDGRYEIIHGEILPKAAPRLEHSSLAVKLCALLARRFDRRPGGKWPGGWRLLSELHVEYETGELFCHDLCGFRRDLHVDLSPAWPMRARPDWVCETVSPGHEKRDRVDKWSVLFRARVPHYWIVSAEDKTLEVHRWTAEGYTRVLAATSGDVIRAEPFDAVELRTAVFFDDEDDDE
jgi:Uma2 family endonuclease